MRLTLEMSLDNAAFFDAEGGRDGFEVARILHRLADDVEATGITGGERGELRDVNGNTTGHWRVTR